ncbi:OGG1, partial [Symbiodinium microadriaticum]
MGKIISKAPAPVRMLSLLHQLRLRKQGLCFPSLQQNTSPTAILPDFITVLGRKLDNGDEAKDKCRAMGVARAASIADQIETSLKTLQTVYDDLLKLQASAATATKDDDMIEEAILKKYVEATKEDLALNNYVQRGKPQDSESSSDDLFEELLEGISGGRDPLLERLGKCARGGSGNACRNLHRMLTDEKLSLPVSISIIDVPIKEPHRKCSRIVGWPVLRLSDWARCALGRAGHMLLAGHCLEDEPAWRMELKMFWDRYSLIDGEHPLFSSGIVRYADKTYKLHFACLGGK